MSDRLAAESSIYVAGHRGLVGSALMRALERHGFKRLIVRTHAELDLTDQGRVREFFAQERPEFVFLAAAKVGGILANDTYPADFIQQNLAIESNVLHESWRCGAKRLIFLGSSCIYPRDCPQPIREEYLLTGPLEPTNQAYAIAKIAGIEMCAAYNSQHGTRYLCVMPSNLYGSGDNFDLMTSHVLPALVRKAHEAKTRGESKVVAWGTGRPRRELLSSDDLAEACVRLMKTDWEEVVASTPSPRLPLLNIGTGDDISIAELMKLVCDTVGFTGRIEWDHSKPDGTPRKLLDVSRMSSLGWRAKTPLSEGIEAVYRAYLDTEATA